MSRARAASAGIWSSIDVLLRQMVQFVVSIILARLLMPADFGIIALATFFSSLAVVFIQGGLTTALVQRQGTSYAEENAGFWLNLAASGVFALILVAVASPVASFYGQPLLRPLLFMAGAQVVLSALGAVQMALLTREMRFATLAKAGIASGIASGALGVAAAFYGAGVWALALQSILSVAVYSAALWLASPWRPSWRVQFGAARPLISFGAWLSLSSVLEVGYTQGFSLLLGKLHGVRDLGLYTRGANTQLLPTTVISTILARIVLPLFAPRADDAGAMLRGLRMANALVMLLNVPMMLGLILIPGPVIQTLFGAKWLPAAPILAILAVGGLFYPLHVMNLQILLAQGKSNTFFRIEIAKKLVGLVCVIVGSIFGIKGLAWSQVAMSIIALGINLEPTRRSLGYGLGRQLWDLRGIAACAAAMAAVVLPLSYAVANLSAPVQLAIVVPAGAAVYFLCGFLFRMDAFTSASATFLSLLPARDARGGEAIPFSGEAPR